jgi:hypothetical protein
MGKKKHKGPSGGPSRSSTANEFEARCRRSDELTAKEAWEDAKEAAVDSWTAQQYLLVPMLKAWGERQHEWFWKFLAHYLSGNGAKLEEFKVIPMEWQNAIKANWKKKGSIRKDIMKKHPEKYRKGVYRIKAYNWGVNDLTRCLGHFDLKYTKKGKTETYEINDVYEFPYYDELDGKLKKHGGQNVELSPELSAMFLKLMPCNEYVVPEGKAKGTIQRFELISKGRNKWDIYLPAVWLQANGKPFPFSASFSSDFHVNEYVESFDDETLMVFADFDEDDLANDLMFFKNQEAVIQVLKHLQENRASSAAQVAEYFILGLEARKASPKLRDLKKMPALVKQLKEMLPESPVAAKLP